jgi:UDPglucose 6-dehydrogenase
MMYESQEVKSMKITVVGTGYVGLVTGTCFAEAGNDVVCVDIDEAKVARMKKGQIPIYEPGLEHLFKRNIKEDRISFTTDLKKGIDGAEVIFLALPTPPGEDGAADLSYVLGVAKDLGPMLKQYTIVVDKSTVPVGTAEKVREEISKSAKVEFDVVSNPEFLREGHAVEDFQRPDRVVIGTSSAKARKVMNKLYRDFVKSGNPIHFMDERSAEMTKYAANAFLATKISFMNQIANLCEIVGAEVDEIRLGIGSDPRIGQQFLYAGIGYGGSCFPKDVLALRQTATENGYTLGILEAVSSANADQKRRLFEKVIKYYDGDVSGKTFALWGLAFKPGTDDIREAPALEIIDALTAKGAKVAAFDPEAMENVRQYHPNDKLSFADTAYAALKDADALIIATEWSEFRTADFTKMKSALKEPVIFDGRNIYEPEELADLGFYYESMGRALVAGKAGKHG